MCPDGGASGNGKEQNLSVVRPVINGKHRKRCHSCESKPYLCLRGAYPKRPHAPRDEQWSANNPGYRIIKSGIVAEDAYRRLQCDDHATGAVAYAGRPGIGDSTSRGNQFKIETDLLNPMRRHLVDPDKRENAQSADNDERLQSPLAVRTSGDKQVEPNRSRVVRLNREACSEKDHSHECKSAGIKTPDRNRT